MRWRSPDRSYEPYESRPPVVGIATTLVGAVAVGAGVLSIPGVSRWVLTRLGRWSMEYATRHRDVARARGLFWISSTANRLTRGGPGGEILHDLQHLALRRVMFEGLDTYLEQSGLSVAEQSVMRRILEESITSQTRVSAMLRARSRQELFSGKPFDFVSKALGDLGAAEADRVMRHTRRFAMGRVRYARQLASSLDTAGIAQSVVEMAREEIRAGEELSPWLRWIGKRAGFRQLSLLDLFHTGLFAKTPEEALALAEGYRRGYRLPLHEMSRSKLEQLAMQATDEVERKYYEAVLRNYHSVLGHLQVVLDPAELVVHRQKNRLVSYSVSSEGMRRLAGIAGTGIMGGASHATRDEIVDLSYVLPALHHMIQNISAQVGIPLSPYMAALNPFRLFPWHRPSEHWFHRIGWSARQVGLSEALGRERGEVLGAPVYVFGRRAFALGLGDAESGQIVPNAKAAFTELEGRWRAVHIRGESMRGMLESLVSAGRHGAYRNRILEWLDVGAQTEESFWSKVRRAVRRGDDPLDPLVALEQIRTGDIQGMTQQQVLELVGRFNTVAEFVDISSTFDEFQLLNDWARHLEWLAGQVGTKTERERILAWRDLVQRVVVAGDYERAIELFRTGGTGPAEWLSALSHQRATGQLAELGYHVGNMLKGDTNVYALSSAMQNILESNRNPWVWISERRTPYRFPTLIDPVPEVAFGRQDAVPNVRFLLRGMLSESLQSAMDIASGNPSLERELYRRFLSMGAGHDAATAWIYTSLFREGLNVSGDVDHLRRILASVQTHLSGSYQQIESLRRYLQAHRLSLIHI